MDNLIAIIKSHHDFLKKEDFLPAESGTMHQVYVSKNFVIRVRTKDKEILHRESKLLSGINHSLVPKILYFGQMDGSFYNIENRLPGRTISLVWRNLSVQSKLNIMSQMVDFLRFLRTQSSSRFFSIKTGKVYKKFYGYLVDDIATKVKNISKFDEAKGLLSKLLQIIQKPNGESLFSSDPILTHGDLIFHNLLTDGHNLTGVLDWELSFFGDPEYDIFRLMNFQKSAKLYLDRGEDEEFEFDFLDRLLNTIEKSGLIADKSRFMAKYEIVKAVYYLNALFWASNSDNSGKYILETIKEWENSNPKTKQ